MASETVVGVGRVGVNTVDVLRWSKPSILFSRVLMDVASKWPNVHVFLFFPWVC